MQPLMQVKIAGTDTIILALDRARDPMGPVGKTGIRLVGNLAAAGRGVLMDSFTNHSGPSSLLYNNMDSRSKKNKPSMSRGASGYYIIDSIGRRRRLIQISLKNRGGFRKEAHLSSFPMNLWERRKDGRGKWIMTVKLAPLVASKGPKYIAIAEAELAAEMEELMRKGK